jgi:hypothetical protein
MEADATNSEQSLAFGSALGIVSRDLTLEDASQAFRRIVRHHSTVLTTLLQHPYCFGDECSYRLEVGRFGG